MPDDRLIHRALGHSAKINSLTDFDRLVWLVYKLASDDFGVMRFEAIAFQNAAEWLAVKPAKTVQKAIDRIAGVGLVRTFEHQGRVYCYQHDWQKWQKITYPRQTSQPAPPLSSLDRDTQWLFTCHPKGGKLKAWQAPETFREDSGNTSEMLPEHSGPVFVRSDCVGVDRSVGVCVGEDQNLPAHSRRDSRSVEKLLKTGGLSEVPPTVRDQPSDPGSGAGHAGRGVESPDQGTDVSSRLRVSRAGHAGAGDECSTGGAREGEWSSPAELLDPEALRAGIESGRAEAQRRRKEWRRSYGLEGSSGPPETRH